MPGSNIPQSLRICDEYQTLDRSQVEKGNSILFTKDSECLQELIHLIVQLQNHRTLVLWVFDCVRSTLAAFEANILLKLDPERRLSWGEAWARGTIKMQVAKKAILDAHAVANELDDKEAIALVHAIGTGRIYGACRDPCAWSGGV